MTDDEADPGGLTPAQRTLRARIAAYSLHAQRDPRETTKAARDKFQERFLNEVDPDRSLEPKERERRAEAARKAYFAKLALRSSVVRRERRARGGQS